MIFILNIIAIKETLIFGKIDTREDFTIFNHILLLENKKAYVHFRVVSLGQKKSSIELEREN